MADQCNLIATLDLSSSEGNADSELYANSAPFPFPLDNDEYFTSDGDHDISASADDDEMKDMEHLSPANLDDEDGIVQFIDDEESLEEFNEE